MKLYHRHFLSTVFSPSIHSSTEILYIWVAPLLLEFDPSSISELHSGATNMNVPPIGRPSPVASLKALILNIIVEVEAVTSVCESKLAGWSKIRNMYLVEFTRR